MECKLVKGGGRSQSGEGIRAFADEFP